MNTTSKLISLIIVLFSSLKTIAQYSYEIELQKKSEGGSSLTVTKAFFPFRGSSQISFSSVHRNWYNITDSILTIDKYIGKNIAEKLSASIGKDLRYRKTLSDDDSITYFTLSFMNAESASLNFADFPVLINHSNLKTFNLIQSKSDIIRLQDDTINHFSSQNDSIDELRISYALIKAININGSSIGTLICNKVPIPDSIDLTDVTLNNTNTPINLSNFDNLKNKECRLSIIGTDPGILNLNYINYSLDDKWYHSENHNNYSLDKIYIALLEVQKKNAYLDGFEKLDKEYKKYKYTKNGKLAGYFFNWLDKNWWDYGYNKSLIFRNSLILMLLFFIINLFLYKLLVHEIYVLEEFSLADHRALQKYKQTSLVRHLITAIYCLLYTGYIFWGLKLEVTKIRLINIWLVLYLILQYITGIICVAYLANYILSK